VIRLAIRCHSCVPVAAVELEDWFADQVDSLREANPTATIRLMRLTQKLPDSEVDVGWLLELEVPEEARLAGTDSVAGDLAEIFRDMRFLGLEPRVLAPVRLSDWPEVPYLSTAMEHPSTYEAVS
jgi:hypothetical protein